MEERIDTLIEELETITTKINKLNFSIEGLQEEIERLEEKQPFMVRVIDSNRRKLSKLFKQSVELQIQKKELDTEYEVFQVKKAAESNPNTTVEKTKIEEEPKQSNE